MKVQHRCKPLFWREEEKRVLHYWHEYLYIMVERFYGVPCSPSTFGNHEGGGRPGADIPIHSVGFAIRIHRNFAFKWLTSSPKLRYRYKCTYVFYTYRSTVLLIVRFLTWNKNTVIASAITIHVMRRQKLCIEKK